MPARAHVVDRRHEVDRAQDRRDAGEVDQEDPGVHAAAGRVGVVGERRVEGPAVLRRLEEDRGVEGDAAEQQQPERERVQAREGHVAGADHQRHEVVGEARQHRHDEQEDHRGAVHGHEGVVGLRRDQRVVRLEQLEAHDQRLDAADDEEPEGGEQVEDPDLLVVGGGEPVEPAARAVPEAVHHHLGAGGGPWDRRGFHYCTPPVRSRCERCCASPVWAALMSARCRFSHAWNCAGVTARTRARMSAWPKPQSSAHWPP